MYLPVEDKNKVQGFKVQAALHEKYLPLGEELSRKGAKTQSATAFLRVFFASLRLCARKMFSHRGHQMSFECFPGKAGSTSSSIFAVLYLFVGPISLAAAFKPVVAFIGFHSLVARNLPALPAFSTRAGLRLS